MRFTLSPVSYTILTRVVHCMLYDGTAYGTPNDTGCVTVFDRMTATTNAVLIYRIRKVTYKHSLKLPVFCVLNFFCENLCL